MAVTTRSARFPSTGATSGPDPTSYTPRHPSELGRVNKLYAPFTSTEPRYRPTPLEGHAPGPGSYTVTEPSRPFHNSQSHFLSSAPREGTTIAPGPGPAAYSPHESHAPQRPVPRRRARSTPPTNAISPPSIPSKGAAGFVESSPGVLAPHPGNVSRMAGTPTDSPGPGHYGGDGVRSYVKGAAFSRAPPRFEPPATVDLLATADASVVHEGAAVGAEDSRPSHFFLSAVSRDAIGTMSNSRPGPGTYNLTKYTDFKSALQVALSEPNRVQAFSTLAPRTFSSTTGNGTTPGPGAYDVNDNARRVKGATSFGRAPPRDPSPPRGGNGGADRSGAFDLSREPLDRVAGGAQMARAGHGTLTLAAMEGVGNNPWKPRTRLRGAFGSSSPRFTKADTGPQPTSATLPHLAPGSHVTSVGGGGPQRGVLRVPPAPSARPTPRVDQSGPPPGAYYRPEDWGPKTHSRTGGVLTSSRFNDSMSGVPGPASYIPPEPATLRKAAAFSFSGVRLVLFMVNSVPISITRTQQSTRFVERKPEGPGPGAYSSGRGLVKRSFNITVGDYWE